MWSIELFIRYKIDVFRGLIISDIVNLITTEDPSWIESAVKNCSETNELGFVPDQKDFDEMLQDLRKIKEVVPLNEEVTNAITHVFGGEWEEAIEALNKLRNERNEQN